MLDFFNTQQHNKRKIFLDNIHKEQKWYSTRITAKKLKKRLVNFAVYGFLWEFFFNDHFLDLSWWKGQRDCHLGREVGLDELRQAWNIEFYTS